MSTITIRHPQYNKNIGSWNKYRLTYTGGEAFRSAYLKHFSSRESETDFSERTDVTHVPAFAKAAVIEIKNAIYNRLNEVKRLGGPQGYEIAMSTNVDLHGSTMNAFIGGFVLPELLAIGKVGIFIDVTRNDLGTGTKQDDQNRTPYVYLYTAEQILSWNYGSDAKLQSVLLESNISKNDPETGLVTDEEVEYRLFVRTESGVTLTKYDKNGIVTATEAFDWPEIPLCIAEIKESLLVDACEYQIGLMNLSSSDMIHGIKANFPFYTEQRDPKAQNALRAQKVINGTSDGTATKADTSTAEEIRVGNIKGRAYGKDLERPAFIHPSSEPMDISLRKQETMKREIRQLVQLAVTNMDPRRESAESKQIDSRGLEAGLSYIAQELEKIEREIASKWAMYYTTSAPAEIRYPSDYSLVSDSDRISQAESLLELAAKSPSRTYQRELSKLVVDSLLRHRITADSLTAIRDEIEVASVVIVDPTVVQKDVELQICSADTAAKIRGYGAGEALKAQKERAIRAAQIVAAQTQAARDESTTEEEKKDLDQDMASDPDPGKKVRGEE